MNFKYNSTYDKVLSINENKHLMIIIMNISSFNSNFFLSSQFILLMTIQMTKVKVCSAFVDEVMKYKLKFKTLNKWLEYYCGNFY
jgi:hypothetical protein